jgi:hypothetical protein
MNKQTQDWFNRIYQAAFRLVYAHDGHVTRVVFIFLNVWWLVVLLVPGYRAENLVGGLGASVYITIGLCTIGVLNGFLLLLFRENELFIGINYAVTMVLLLTGALTSVVNHQYDPSFGAFVALAALAALSYVRYSIKAHNSFPALMKKAHIDVEMVERKVVALAAAENGGGTIDARVDTN